jgi:hypothetical protein
MWASRELFVQGDRDGHCLGSCQPTLDLVVSETKQNSFLCTNSQFLSGIMTVQGKDFSGTTTKKVCSPVIYYLGIKIDC